MSQTLRGLTALGRADNRETRRSVPKPFTNPILPFNVALTSERSFVSLSLPLSDFLHVKRALHVTLNDVVLAVCGGALRAHLESTGQLPDRPVLASIPINTQPDVTGRLRGNHVGNLLTSLCTDIADPIERIQAIAVITRASKWEQQTMGTDIYERWFDYSPPSLHSGIVRFWARHHLSNRFRAPMNLVVSNVRGPAQKISLRGAKLEALYSVGPVLEGVGLNITGWSYADRLNLVALACATGFPDLRSFVDRMPTALAELIEACDAPGMATGEVAASTNPPNESVAAHGGQTASPPGA